MSELLGASYYPDDFRNYLLVFDRIVCSDIDRFIAASTAKPELAHFAADFQFLAERGILVQPRRDPFRHDLSPEAEAEIRSLTDTWRREQFDVARSEHDSPARTEARNFLVDSVTRMFAVSLRDSERVDAVPLVTEWSTRPRSQVARADVIHLVISELPVPGPEVSLEDILAFREEAGAEGLVQGIRVWINEMASGKLTATEVSDKLEDLVARYERALTLERMSRTTGVIETLVCTSAEIAESLVKFKWSNIARMLFQVGHKKIDLMKAEMTLPGREVAYIVKARERFAR